MDKILWLSLLPPLITIVAAVWSKQIIPSLLLGLLAGGYLLNPTLNGGIEATVISIVSTLTDKGNLQVLLFLYLFSGLIALIKNSGGIKAFSKLAERKVRDKRGVFFSLWALIPVTFIDCGFRVVGAGAITKSLATKNGVARERLAFMLNNTASPVVELIPVATTFVGFNVAIISQGLTAAGKAGTTSAYAVWLHAIPLEFFSIAVLLVTFGSIFLRGKKTAGTDRHEQTEESKMSMDMENQTAIQKPRVANLLVPMFSVISLSIFFFWFLGKRQSGDNSFVRAITNSEPNRAMLIALLITIIVSALLYAFQKYKLKKMTADVISGGNEIMSTLAILILAWSLAAVSQKLGLGRVIEQQLGGALPAWSLAVLLFITSAAITFFIGSGWGTASLIMPFAIPLAVSVGAAIPLCVAAVITGGTFGDVTSPVAGMTNMAANVVGADYAKYLKYAWPYNFLAAGIAAVSFLISGLL